MLQYELRILPLRGRQRACSPKSLHGEHVSELHTASKLIEAMKRRAYQKIICLVWSRSAEHTFFSHINFPGPPSTAEQTPPPQPSNTEAADFNSLDSAFRLYKFHPFHLRVAFIIRNVSLYVQ